MAVADGIGGHACADMASQMCIRALMSAWRLYLYGESASVEQVERFLTHQIQQVNETIFTLNQAQALSNPWGTR